MENHAQSLEATIRAEAYLLSEQAGHPPGMDKFFWLQAEEMVLSRELAAVNGKRVVVSRRRKAGTAEEVRRKRAVNRAKKTVSGKMAGAR